MSDIFGGEPVNITHKPKRMQHEINKPRKQEENNSVKVPVNVTIEKAIKFYEAEALREGQDPSLCILYFQTAKWLRDLMSRNRKPSEGEENNG